MALFEVRVFFNTPGQAHHGLLLTSCVIDRPSLQVALDDAEAWVRAEALNDFGALDVRVREALRLPRVPADQEVPDA